MTLPTKPPIDSPCNGCGICCIAEQCRVSVDLFGTAQVCPALEWEDAKFWCGLMRHPGAYDAEIEHLKQFGEAISVGYYQRLIGGGKGCDSDDLSAEESPSWML